MNNNAYYNYRPNLSFVRNVPISRFNPAFASSRSLISPLPRIGSLLSGGTRALGPASTLINSGTGAAKLSFSSILSGAGKTLGVINQAIPVFYQVKPLFKNAKTILRVFKEMNSNDVNSSTTLKTSEIDDKNIISDVDKNIEIEEKINTEKEDNSPTFFI